MKPLAIIFAIIACSLIFASLGVMLNSFELVSTNMEAVTVANGAVPVDDTAATVSIDLIWAIGGVLIVAALIVEAFQP
jgi:hypothetical protein